MLKNDLVGLSVWRRNVSFSGRLSLLASFNASVARARMCSFVIRDLVVSSGTHEKPYAGPRDPVSFPPGSSLNVLVCLGHEVGGGA